MRKFDKLSNEKFGGNAKKTIHYLLFNNDNVSYDDYSDELTEKEKTIAYKYFFLYMQKANGGKKGFQKALNQQRKLESLKMTEEEILSSKKNPYSKKLIIHFIILICIIILPILLAFTLSKFNINHKFIYYCQAIGVSIIALDLSTVLINYQKFNKLKKELQKPVEEVPQEEIVISADALTDEEIDSIEVEEKEITRSTLIRELLDIFKDKRSNGLAFVVLTSIFIFCTCINILWLLPTIIWFIISVIFFINGVIMVNRTNSLDFRIVKDECIGKTDKTEQDSWVSRHFLHFKKYGKHKIYDSGRILYKTWTASTFNNTSIGDKFYLVLMGSGNHIALVFPEKEWKLIPEEFTIENDIIYPKKDKQVNEILSEKLKQQKSTYSEVSLEKVQNAKELSKIHTKKTISYGLFVLWGLLICFISIIIATATKFLPLAIILAIGLAALYILKTVSLYKAMLKAQKAIFFLPNEYVEYKKLNSRYNLKVAIACILTIINIFVVGLSIPLSIAMVFHQ